MNTASYNLIKSFYERNDVTYTPPTEGSEEDTSKYFKEGCHIGLEPRFIEATINSSLNNFEEQYFLGLPYWMAQENKELLSNDGKGKLTLKNALVKNYYDIENSVTPKEYYKTVSYTLSYSSTSTTQKKYMQDPDNSNKEEYIELHKCYPEADDKDDKILTLIKFTKKKSSEGTSIKIINHMNNGENYLSEYDRHVAEKVDNHVYTHKAVKFIRSKLTNFSTDEDSLSDMMYFKSKIWKVSPLRNSNLNNLEEQIILNAVDNNFIKDTKTTNTTTTYNINSNNDYYTSKEISIQEKFQTKPIILVMPNENNENILNITADSNVILFDETSLCCLNTFPIWSLDDSGKLKVVEEEKEKIIKNTLDKVLSDTDTNGKSKEVIRKKILKYTNDNRIITEEYIVNDLQ